MRGACLAVLFLLLGCRGGGAADAGANDSQRQADLLANQAAAIHREAESNTSAAVQALENETAEIFENREKLLNQAADNEAAAGNRQ